jgi:pimeloyl-ACP methyl ester carboxylesterase
MQRHLFLRLIAGVFASALTLLALPAAAQERIGVLMLHGKSPGNNQDRNFLPTKALLEKEGMLVAFPDMPWSRNRYLDGNWDKAMSEIGAQVATLRSQGAGKIVLIGHSLGVPAAMSFAARGGDVQALVLLAPGHIPRGYYTMPFLKPVRDSVDEARALVAAGKGDSNERFSDINQGKQQTIVTTAKNFLSYFEPESDADMGVTAPRIPPGTPVLTVLGDDDFMFTRSRDYFANKLPANPKSQYLEVKANHLTTPAVANDAVVRWVKTTLAP